MQDTLVPETNIERDQLPTPAETWTTGDLRPGREAERWLNTLLRKREAAWARS